MSSNNASKQRGRRSLFLVVVIAAVVVSGTRIVVSAISESDRGQTRALMQTVIFSSIGFVLFAALCVGLAIAIVPTSKRTALLKRQFPDSVVFTGRWNSVLKELLAVDFLAPGHSPTELGGVAFTLCAGGSGLSFWGGQPQPVKLAEIPWTSVKDVEVGSLALSAVRSVPCVKLELKSLNGQAEFALGSEAWGGMFPRGTEGVQFISDALKGKMLESRPLA